MKKYIIGLTGQSGSGKSVVAKILNEKGIKILDCDEIAHKNMEIGGKAYSEIIEYFGRDILNSDNTINRKSLGAIVFNNKEELIRLNEITHRHIFDYIKKETENTENIIVIDAPLLFEAGLDRLCNSIWAVVCDENIRLERVIKRDGISRENALARFKNQKSSEFFMENADIIFENSGDIDSLRERAIYEINKILD